MKNTDIIKDKLNILDVVGSYVKLEKTGKTYKGKSPFTNEKTPSFFVSPEKGFFYCFSSAKGGDMFTFIEEIERVDFKEALKILAQQAGVDLQTNYTNSQSHNDTLYCILDDITKRYEVYIRKNSDIIDYLLGRGLSKDTIVQFRLGFSQDSWQDCYDYLKSLKYTDEDIELTGLIIKKKGSGYYDRFRSRIMFPLFDGRGRIIGFSGRIHSSGDSKETAKYINSPEGPIFDKSRVLYGYHIAKTSMSKEDCCIIVEGQFDVLLAQQAGYTNTVAISGTGLTSEHIFMIKRFTSTILLAFDSDKAGIKATRRSIITAYEHGMNVRVILIPDQMDPADLIAHSKEQWDVCVRDSKDYIDYRLELFSQQEHSFEEKKNLIEQDLFTFVFLMQSAILQDRILQKFALLLGVSVDSVRNDFSAFKPEEEFKHVQDKKKKPTKTPTVDIQKNILYLYNYILEKGYLKEDGTEYLNQSKDIYLRMYASILDSDTENLDQTERNMQFFIYEEQHRDTLNHLFPKMLYTAIAEEYIRKLQEDSDLLLQKIRQAESKEKNEEMIEFQKKHQELLVLRTDIIHNLNR